MPLKLWSLREHLVCFSQECAGLNKAYIFFEVLLDKLEDADYWEPIKQQIITSFRNMSLGVVVLILISWTLPINWLDLLAEGWHIYWLWLLTFEVLVIIYAYQIKTVYCRTQWKPASSLTFDKHFSIHEMSSFTTWKFYNVQPLYYSSMLGNSALPIFPEKTQEYWLCLIWGRLLTTTLSYSLLLLEVNVSHWKDLNNRELSKIEKSSFPLSSSHSILNLSPVAMYIIIHFYKMFRIN